MKDCEGFYNDCDYYDDGAGNGRDNMTMILMMRVKTIMVMMGVRTIMVMMK